MRKPPSLQLLLRSPELLAPRVLVALQPSRVRLVPEHPVPAVLVPETTPTHPAKGCLVPVVAKVVAGERVRLAAAPRVASVPRVLRAHRVGAPEALVRSEVARQQAAVRVRTRE